MAEMTLVNLLEARANTYALLARLTRTEMDECALASLCSMRFPQGTGNDDVDKGYGLLHAYLGGKWERTIEDLARDFARTFIGSDTTAHAAAYPNESVYTSPDRLMMQSARDEVMALYHAEGFLNEKDWSEGEDHIAIELEFMERLSRRAAEALARGDEGAALRILRSQEGFMVEHLSAWVPDFTTEMLKFAATDFYRGVAYVLRGFVEQDREFLREIVGSDDVDKA